MSVFLLAVATALFFVAGLVLADHLWWTFRRLASAGWSDAAVRAERWRLLRHLASLTVDVFAFIWVARLLADALSSL